MLGNYEQITNILSITISIPIIFLISLFILKKFRKEHDLPDVKGIVFEGNILPGSEFKRIADLPTKDQLLAQLVSMLNSPMTKLVWGLKSPMTDMGNALSNLKNEKFN